MAVSRRRLLQIALAMPGGAMLARRLALAEPVPKTSRGPVVISSSNGLRAVEKAYQLLAGGPVDPLDAAIAGVNILELDPEEQGVGLGGLPNEDGVVQLDASCMHGPSRRAGAVAAIEGIATPSLVAKAVLEHTNHVMLAGDGAKRFALALGFPETNLLTEKSRQEWLRWKASLEPASNWLEPDPIGPVRHKQGTVTVCALDAKGDLASVTSTSGLSWKIPGRVGDSPIVGAGQYCDNRIGAAGSTDRGESNMKVCGTFFVVEQMRAGASPTEACLRGLRRAVEMTEDRLLDEKGRPLFDLCYYALSRSGAHGAAVLYAADEAEAATGIGTYTVADTAGARREQATPLFAVGERPAALRRRTPPVATTGGRPAQP